MTTPAAEYQPEKARRRRRVAMTAAAAVFAAIGIAAALWWLIEARHYESTDDAYVAGNVVTITPQVAGTVIAIRAEDTDLVRAGDELVALDQSDSKTALEQAEADLAQTVREVHSLRVTSASLRAEVKLRETQLAKAEQDLARRRKLADSGAVSSEELHHARTAVQAAQADLLAAREKLATNQALTGAGPLADNPRVRLAAAKVREAYLDWRRSSIPAPVTGYVAKRSVQLGQRVHPGDPLLAVVPLGQVWIDANFKEGQLEDMRIGQPVTLEADMYGGSVTYHGKVVGLAAGTGSAFSLLPAQNATGNWIKVVQRVPVRIALNRDELKRHPLRIGLSVTAKVNVADQSGDQLARKPRDATAYQTDVYAGLDAAADRRVAAIISANADTAPVAGERHDSHPGAGVAHPAADRISDSAGDPAGQAW